MLRGYCAAWECPTVVTERQCVELGSCAKAS
jgi:hypothetical protein